MHIKCGMTPLPEEDLGRFEQARRGCIGWYVELAKRVGAILNKGYHPKGFRFEQMNPVHAIQKKKESL